MEKDFNQNFCKATKKKKKNKNKKNIFYRQEDLSNW